MNTTPLILTVAPNGAYKQQADHSALPMTPSTLAATVRECLDAGAAMLHLHILDGAGRHSLEVAGYREALAAVRAAVGNAMVLQVTSEAAGVYEATAQIHMVRTLRPEAVSVGLREIDRPNIGEAGLADFFTWLVTEQVMTQIILYDVKDLQRWQQLRSQSVIPDGRWSLLFVLGRYSAGQTSRPRDLVTFLQAHTGHEPWMVCAFGASEHACVTAAAALGGHARVGFENNLLLLNGEPAPHNAALVRQAAQTSACLGRPLATAQQIREEFFAA